MKTALLGLLMALACRHGHAQSYAVFSFDAPPGLSLQRVEGLNNVGQILGTYLDSSQGFHSLLRSADGATYTAIEVPGAAGTNATGINNLGQVVGNYTDASGTHAFVRSADGSFATFDVTTDSPRTIRPSLSAINDKGEIAGTAFVGLNVGFVLSADRKTYTPISVPGTSSTEVSSIDNNGNIVGTAQFGGSYGLRHGFLRKPDGTYTLIDAPGMADGTSVIASNNRGQLIANSVVLNPDGSSAALDPTLGGAPTAIDDAGRLGGCAQSGAACRGFLAVPAAGAPPGAPPVIRPVRGVASASGFGGSETIAPGSWIEIYGSHLAQTTRAWQTSDFNGNAAPPSLEGVSVTISGRRAIVSYISPGQVNALVPASLAPGTAQVMVTNGSQTSAGYRATVAAVNPGVLAISQAVATNYVLALFPDFQTYSLPPVRYPSIPPLPAVPSRPAKSGDTIILYGIGFGPVTPDVLVGQIATGTTSLQGRLEVSIGGMPARVDYAGLAPGSVGLYQFNIVVPDGVHGVTGLGINLNGDPVRQPLSLVLQP